MLFPRTGKVDVGFASPRRSYPEAAAFIACCCWGRRPAGLEEMGIEARWRAVLTSSHHHVVNCSHECPTEVLFRQRYSLPIPVWWHHELGKRPVMSELRRGWLQGQLASPLHWLFLRQRATCPLLAKFSFSTRELCSARLASLQHLSSGIDVSPHSGGCLHLSEHIQVEKGCWDANASDQGCFLAHQTWIPACGSPSDDYKKDLMSVVMRAKVLCVICTKRSHPEGCLPTLIFSGYE